MLATAVTSGVGVASADTTSIAATKALRAYNVRLRSAPGACT